MDEKFSRTEMLIGNEGMEKLKNAKVAVFGLGGVAKQSDQSRQIFQEHIPRHSHC